MDLELKSKAKDIKAMFFDIDGTLLSNNTHKVPLSTLDALEKARRNGMLLFISTGRHKQHVEEIGGFSCIGFTGYITLNGQYCYENGNLVHKNPINPRDVKVMVEYAQKNAVPCFFCEADIMYVNIVDSYVIKEHESVNSFIPEVRDVSRVFEREIFQMGLYLKDGNIPEILSEMPGCTYTRWKAFGIDIIPAGGSKWAGIERMMERFRLSREQVMSFGDSHNDLEMLSNSAISVAMGNSGDSIKHVSDYVTDTVDKDGIYKAMKYFFDWA